MNYNHLMEIMPVQNMEKKSEGGELLHEDMLEEISILINNVMSKEKSTYEDEIEFLEELLVENPSDRYHGGPK